jgi:hypothetical protein
MNSFVPQSSLFRRTPSSDALNRSYRAFDDANQVSEVGTNQIMPQRVGQAIDAFICDALPQEMAQRANRLLIQNVKAAAPRRPTLAVQHGVESCLQKRDPHYGPFVQLLRVRNQGAMNALQNNIRNFFSTLLTQGLEGDALQEMNNALANISYDIDGVSSELISFLVFRKNFSNQEIAAELANPNSQALINGSANMIASMTANMNQLGRNLQFFFARNQVHGPNAASRRSSENFDILMQMNYRFDLIDIPEPAPLPPPVNVLDDSSYAQLLEALGGAQLLFGFKYVPRRSTVGGPISEEDLQLVADDLAAHYRPLISDAFAEFDSMRHRAFIERYPFYPSLVSKQIRVFDEIGETWGEIFKEVIINRLNTRSILP